MAPFRAKNRLKEDENGRKYKLSFGSVPTRRGTENAKKEAKKLKNIIMASFQAKIGRKRMRKRENENNSFVPSLPDA